MRERATREGGTLEVASEPGQGVHIIARFPGKREGPTSGFLTVATQHEREGHAMGKVYDSITEGLARWLGTQPMFFVATAASDHSTRVNVSRGGWTRSVSSGLTAWRGWISPAAAWRP